MASRQDAQFQADLDVTVDLPLASIGSRALAQVIDLLTLFVVLLLVALLLVGLISAEKNLVFLIPISLFALYWGYFTAWEFLTHGQTLGKKILGLRVVNVDGTAVGALGVLVRNLLRIIDFLPVGYGIGGVIVVWNHQHRRLGDLAGGTVVIREHPLASQIPDLKWPEGITAHDAALIEQMFILGPQMIPNRREALSRKTLELVYWRYPQFLEGIEWNQSAWALLVERFAPRSRS